MSGTTRPRWATAAALAAIAFGVATIFAGGKTLFGGTAEREAAGAIVPFVLWFNFVAGFAYVLAGYGFFIWRRWAAILAATIAIATLAIFVALGLHIAGGGGFEWRTIGAMTLRSAVWIAIAIPACRAFRCFGGATQPR